MGEKIKVYGHRIEGEEYTEREGAYGIHINDDSCVAVIRVGNDYFLPGGGIEIDESNLECLVREFHEETGSDIKVIGFVTKMIQYHKSKKAGHYYKLIGNFYLVNMQKKNREVIEVDHNLEWVHINDVNDRMLLEYQADAIHMAHRIAMMNLKALKCYE